MTALKPILAGLADGKSLSEAEAEAAFDVLMSGQATPAQSAAFLMALRVRGETVAELTGAARILRAKVLHVKAPPGAIDTCGTGGDAAGTYNISTAVAFVVAGCGVPVAKHGNRAASSKSGTADVLAALGVNLDCTPAQTQRALEVANIGFLFAQKHHSAMKHVGAVRAELGIRTIFNLVGPLSNPAGARRQLLGVFSRKWIVPLAETLGRLGTERAWVVHGADGLDELTTTAPSFVAALEDGEVRTFELTPEDAGLTRTTAETLKGGGPEHNAAALRDVLSGTGGAYRDIVLLNAAAALIVAGKVAGLKDGVQTAAAAIDTGRARQALDMLVQITNTAP